MASANNFLESDDDDILAEETLEDKMTKESFLSMVENASEGGDISKILNLLPNSSQRYGHALTMNALVKILCRHPSFKDRCTTFYTTKMKAGKKTNVV
jgi:arsenate reductase-like glutaredoxin family protein